MYIIIITHVLYLVLSMSLVINWIESGRTVPAGDISRLRGGQVPHVDRKGGSNYCELLI